MTCLLPERVVQLHLTTRCNLACAHCYSSSGPSGGRSLDVADIVGALGPLRDHGFEVLSLSGGEPLLYPDLVPVVAEARRLGFRVTVVTNGAAVTRAKAAALSGLVGTAAVSFDGTPEHHDVIRCKPGGFDLAARGLRWLREAGTPCGVICCVTRTTLPDVPWLYQFARDEGASLLQLRPLALTGRGEGLVDESLDAADCERLAVVAGLLAEGQTAPFVQCDLVHAGQLVEEGPALFPLLLGAPLDGPLSDLVNPLVIAEDGSIRPYVYGLQTRDGLTTLGALAERGWAGLAEETAAELVGLLRRAFSAAGKEPNRFVDFYSVLTDEAAHIGAVER